MKKILIMLGIVGLAHCGASAQVGTYNPDVNNPDPHSTGQKMDVVVPGINNTTTTTSRPRTIVTAHTVTRTYYTPGHTVYHSGTHHYASNHHYTHHYTHKTGAMYAHKKTTTPVHHATAMHRTAHKPMHAVATTTRRTGTYASGMHTNTYAGYRAPVKHTVTITVYDTTRVDRQRTSDDGAWDISKIPGASNGGWDNGTNGRGGTESEDGTLHPDKP